MPVTASDSSAQYLEQLMSTEWLICIEGFAIRADECLRTSIRVSSPDRVAGVGEYRCRVSVTPFLNKEVEIAGIDSQQATELASAFARSIVGVDWLEDEAGRKTHW